jgi:hypothetical protein
VHKPNTKNPHTIIQLHSGDFRTLLRKKIKKIERRASETAQANRFFSLRGDSTGQTFLCFLRLDLCGLCSFCGGLLPDWHGEDRPAAKEG